LGFICFLIRIIFFSGTVGSGKLLDEGSDVAGTSFGTGGSGELATDEAGGAGGDIDIKLLLFFFHFFIFK